MTLLITVFAAVIVTVLWYIRKDDTMKLGILIFMYWGNLAGEAADSGSQRFSSRSIKK